MRSDNRNEAYKNLKRGFTLFMIPYYLKTTKLKAKIVLVH